MKNRKVIINIIIYIILIGVIISLISRNGIIREKQVIKEMSESTQVSNLQNQINQLNSSQEEYAKNVQIYKAKIAEAITNQKVTTSENATADEIVTNIGEILKARTKDATATAEDIAEGKTAWVNGELIEGNKNNTITVESKDFISPQGWNSIVTLTIDLSSVSGFQELVLWKSIFVRINQSQCSHDQYFGYSYNQNTGILTITAKQLNSETTYGFRGTVYYITK